MHVSKYQPAITVDIAEGTVLTVQGLASESKVIKIQNLDLANTLTYKFQYSLDGATWTDLAVSATLAPEAHIVTTLTTYVFHRLRASGNLTIAVEVSAYQAWNDVFSFVNL